MFDGKKFSKKLETELSSRVTNLSGRLMRRPKLVGLVDPANEAGMKYCQIKSKVAKRLDVEFVIKIISTVNQSQISNLLHEWNVDDGVDGIMIQLPFGGSEKLIPLIDSVKDIDGLRGDSPFVPATVRAVQEILGYSFKDRPYKSVLVVGSRGVVGRGLMKELPGAEGMDKEDFDPGKLKSADVVISCTGQAGLIGPEMVKEKVTAIDVGYPKGDFDPEVAQKAAFFTPVPGGVGPVTVVMLFTNLAEAAEGKLDHL